MGVLVLLLLALRAARSRLESPPSRDIGKLYGGDGAGVAAATADGEPAPAARRTPPPPPESRVLPSSPPPPGPL
uniref:Uncharacterized protein n=1 Tax=Oryza meridionalis TaxID=40149 RepID=A0A0E0CH00_9ORYZ